MNILRAIGAFFAKIWRWIKQTAWVQPLLIVALIFGVMFSIKPIYNAIKNAKSDSSSVETYYRRFQISLVGGEKSDADEFTRQLEASMGEHKNKIDQSKFATGDKFFFMYVQENCDKCTEAKGGFETFEDHYNDIYQASGFKLVTIFSDEITDDASDDGTAFTDYLDRNKQFFASAGGAIDDSPFVQSGGVTDEELSGICEPDPDNFVGTPLIFMVDFTDGIDEIYRGITDGFIGTREVGDYSNSDAKRARFLADCWNRKGDFERK